MANAKDIGTRVVTGFHEAVFRLTNGRFANREFGMPVLVLRTTGRKSGKKITRDGKTRAMRARVASPEEKAELWPRVVDAYRGYGQYQQRTDRDIPLVICEP